jgi:hypothetical protein
MSVDRSDRMAFKDLRRFSRSSDPGGDGAGAATAELDFGEGEELPRPPIKREKEDAKLRLVDPLPRLLERVVADDAVDIVLRVDLTDPAGLGGCSGMSGDSGGELDPVD